MRFPPKVLWSKNYKRRKNMYNMVGFSIFISLTPFSSYSIFFNFKKVLLFLFVGPFSDLFQDIYKSQKPIFKYFKDGFILIVSLYLILIRDFDPTFKNEEIIHKEHFLFIYMIYYIRYNTNSYYSNQCMMRQKIRWILSIRILTIVKNN